MNKKTIIVDMDGVICTEEKTFSRSLAKPLKYAIESLNTLKEGGNTIIVFTARTWAEYEMTEDWLIKNKIPYDRLICGKPIGDIWIDDRALEHNDWKETLNKINKRLK